MTPRKFWSTFIITSIVTFIIFFSFSLIEYWFGLGTALIVFSISFGVIGSFLTSETEELK